jgi:TfoX/Sxy family transcriptional regulator of competence genes
MPWKNSPQALIDAFAAALPNDPRIDRRQMFGYPCAFVQGNMFTGLHEHRLLVRLPEAQRAELLQQAGATPFEPMPGRVMREYVVVPEAFLSKPQMLRSWIGSAFEYAASLPPKRPKKARTKKSR